MGADGRRFRDELGRCSHPVAMMPAFAHLPDPSRSSQVSERLDPMAAEPDVVQIYEQHFDFAWRSLRRLGVAATDLEDAAQDVFEIVHRRINDFEHRSTLKTWIFGIALRVAKVYRHKAARQRQRVRVEEVLLVSSHANPEQAKAHVQAAEQVQRLLDELDDDKRAVFILSELEQVPAAEIATALGIPPNTVYSRLRLARAAFEAGLRRLQAKDEWRYR
jgi:RNA polymerase sigma-70 factor (ECF subfamily)